LAYETHKLSFNYLERSKIKGYLSEYSCVLAAARRRGAERGHSRVMCTYIETNSRSFIRTWYLHRVGRQSGSAGVLAAAGRRRIVSAAVGRLLEHFVVSSRATCAIHRAAISACMDALISRSLPLSSCGKQNFYTPLRHVNTPRCLQVIMWEVYSPTF
jgi:hypothetical protein